MALITDKGHPVFSSNKKELVRGKIANDFIFILEINGVRLFETILDKDSEYVPDHSKLHCKSIT